MAQLFVMVIVEWISFEYHLNEYDEDGAEDWCLYIEWALEMFFIIDIHGRLLLSDKKRVMPSTRSLYLVQIVGIKLIFAVDTREILGLR